MSDTAFNKYEQYGTNAQRLAFTPNPPASGKPLYTWYETDTNSVWVYDTTWHQVVGSGGTGLNQLTGDVLAGPGTGSQASTLSTTGAVAGTYGDANNTPVLTIDAKGRVTTVTTTPTASGGGITTLTGEVLAGPGTGSQAATLSTTGVISGTYGTTGFIPRITVDAKGRVTTVTTYAETGTGINQLTGDVLAGPGTGSQASVLSTTGVVAGTYGSATLIPVIVVDSKGRATSISTTTASAATAINQLTGDGTAGPGSGSQVLTLTTTGVSAGTYGTTGFIPRITVDAKGRLTSVTTIAETTGGLNQLTGDVLAGPGSGSQVATLKTTGVVAGTYGSTSAIPVITINAKGLVTTISTTTSSGAGGITQLTGDVTAGPGTGSVATLLSTTGVVAGTYGTTAFVPRITIDAKGRITSATTTASQLSGIGALPFPISGGGSPLIIGKTNIYRFPYAIIITGYTIMADQNGNIQFNIYSNAPGTSYPPTSSIVASAPPVLTAAKFLNSTTLTGWTVNIPSGNCIQVEVVSTSGVIKDCTLELNYTYTIG